MPLTPAPLDPPQLLRFPAETREAYRQFRSTGDLSSVQTVVLSAVSEHCPRRPAQALDHSPASAALRLVEDLGYDSLAIAELVFFLEDLFEVSIRTQEIQAIATVGELRSFVAGKLADKSAVA